MTFDIEKELEEVKETKPKQGNVVTAMLALKAGAKVALLNGGRVTLDAEGCMRCAMDDTRVCITYDMLANDMFTISWDTYRYTPKIGDIIAKHNDHKQQFTVLCWHGNGVFLIQDGAKGWSNPKPLWVSLDFIRRDMDLIRNGTDEEILTILTGSPKPRTKEV